MSDSKIWYLQSSVIVKEDLLKNNSDIIKKS